MDNAVHAVASSSASVKPSIVAAEYTSAALLRLTLSGGTSIVSRICYCTFPLTIDTLPMFLTEFQLECLYQAGRIYLAEKQAEHYLNRAEYSTYQLSIKLQKKSFSPQEYQPALQYLTNMKVLNDSRFAAAWLHTRSISKKEGAQRLFSELRKRGIASAIARNALDDFFSETDEETVCKEAVHQLIRKGYRGDKLVRALQRKGFAFSIIKRYVMDDVSAAS